MKIKLFSGNTVSDLERMVSNWCASIEKSTPSKWIEIIDHKLINKNETLIMSIVYKVKSFNIPK